MSFPSGDGRVGIGPQPFARQLPLIAVQFRRQLGTAEQSPFDYAQGVAIARPRLLDASIVLRGRGVTPVAGDATDPWADLARKPRRKRRLGALVPTDKPP